VCASQYRLTKTSLRADYTFSLPPSAYSPTRNFPCCLMFRLFSLFSRPLSRSTNHPRFDFQLFRVPSVVIIRECFALLIPPNTLMSATLQPSTLQFDATYAFLDSALAKEFQGSLKSSEHSLIQNDRLPLHTSKILLGSVFSIKLSYDALSTLSQRMKCIFKE
jgi:hypothetical protein